MLEVQNVSVGYDTPVLQNISFSAQPGKITALIGPNGCGKTTLLKAMARQQPLLAGKIQLDGRSLQSYERKELARHLAFMPQVRTIPEIRVQGLVEHGRFPHLGFSRRLTAADHEIVTAAMEQAGVTAWADRDLRELSGGQRQRVYLAMALAQGGQTILLDEPTTYLDTAAQFQLMELLQSLAQQGRTVVMVLHDLAHAMQYSDAVGVFADGKLSAFAEPSQLYEQKIWEEVFQVKLRKALDGTYYIRPLERNVLFHAVAPVVSKTGLLQNKNAIAACTKS